MDLLPAYLARLSALRLSQAGSHLLSLMAECTTEQALKQLVSVTIEEPVTSFDVTLVRKLQARARHAFYANNPDPDGPERFWLLARVVEFLGSQNHRAFCNFCFKTVEVRSDDRVKDFCPDHASGVESGNRGGYLRGRKYNDAFQKTLVEIGAKIDVGRLEKGFLTHQLNSIRLGAGDAARVVVPKDREKPNWATDSLLSIDELRLSEISHDYPDWTELALRWRRLFNDLEGAQLLEAEPLTVTPRRLLDQWVRWKAWTIAGDCNARVGKGRPALIDRDQAFAFKADGKTNAEIAEFFGVSKGSVDVFFSRQKKLG